MTLFPLAAFDRIDRHVCDTRLRLWQHYLDVCDRPFGIQDFDGVINLRRSPQADDR